MSADDTHPPVPTSSLALRGAVGGTLMGLANLVPGISGGTMLLAAGVYPRFVQAIAEVTTLKFRRESIVLLGSVVAAALVAIVLLAGTVKGFVVDHRWVAYSIFIGLTLGGVPVVWSLVKERGTALWAGAVAGFVAMAALALFQSGGTSSAGTSDAGFLMMFFAGVAGASAMILPGISGGYLLLVLGVYVAILTGIDDVKVALKAGSLSALMDPLLSVVLPVGLGVVIGVVLVSNLIRWLLAKYEMATLGVLLGLLVGAVVGLWPFQQAVAPKVGDTIKGRVVTAEVLAEIKPADYPNEFFSPSGGQIGGALGLIVLGFAATMGVARLGRE